MAFIDSSDTMPLDTSPVMEGQGKLTSLLRVFALGMMVFIV